MKAGTLQIRALLPCSPFSDSLFSNAPSPQIRHRPWFRWLRWVWSSSRGGLCGAEQDLWIESTTQIRVPLSAADERGEAFERRTARFSGAG